MLVTESGYPEKSVINYLVAHELDEIVFNADGFFFIASLAQLAEQVTLNHRVVGSSPTGGTIFLVQHTS